MNKETIELAKGVVEWWLVHQYDTVGRDSNMYNEPPDFVFLAYKILDIGTPT